MFTAQTPTDAQKSRARSNIDAAPDGYGLGKYCTKLTDADNLDTMFAGGWYGWTATVPTGAVGTYSVMRVDPGFDGGNYTRQRIMWIPNRCELQRVNIDGVWQPFEYINPPLAIGVEYRTTERYLNKPVYCKLIDVGALPSAGTTKQVTWDEEGSVRPIFCGGNASNGDVLPYLDSTVEILVTADNKKIYLYAATDRSSVTAQVLIKYYKTAD